MMPPEIQEIGRIADKYQSAKTMPSRYINDFFNLLSLYRLSKAASVRFFDTTIHNRLLLISPAIASIKLSSFVSNPSLFELNRQ